MNLFTIQNLKTFEISIIDNLITMGNGHGSRSVQFGGWGEGGIGLRKFYELYSKVKLVILFNSTY